MTVRVWGGGCPGGASQSCSSPHLFKDDFLHSQMPGAVLGGLWGLKMECEDVVPASKTYYPVWETTTPVPACRANSLSEASMKVLDAETDSSSISETITPYILENKVVGIFRGPRKEQLPFSSPPNLPPVSDISAFFHKKIKYFISQEACGLSPALPRRPLPESWPDPYGALGGSRGTGGGLIVCR